MNIERLSEIARAILSEFQETQVIQRIQTLISALDQVMQQPSQDHENNLNNQLTAFSDSMDLSKLNTFPATWRPYIEELGVIDVLGEPLRRRVESIVSGRGVVQAKAKKQLTAIQSELNDYQDKFQQLVNATDRFDFDSRHVETDLAEISFLFPADQFGSRMSDFAKEVKLMDDAVGFFSELGTGSREEPKMYQLSNPDPFIVAGVTIGTATTILIFVKAVLDTIESTYNLRAARENLREAQASTRTIEAIETDIREKIDAGVYDARRLMFDKFPPEQTRKQELENLADKILPKLVDRLDRGYRIDANANVPPESKEGDEPEEDEIVRKREVTSELVELARQIRYRETPEEAVLQIAAPAVEDDSDEEVELP